jgi:hypothetical protein
MGTIITKILNSLTALVFGAVASRIQTHLLLDHVQHQGLLEQEAARLEAEGKADLAEVLRRQARTVSMEKPAESGRLVLKHLGDDDEPETPRAISQHQPALAPASNRPNAPASNRPKQGRGRPRKSPHEEL